MGSFQCCYIAWCLFELDMGLFSHHAYPFLHCIALCVSISLAWVGWKLYQTELKTDMWQRLEDEVELHGVTTHATQHYQQPNHHRQHTGSINNKYAAPENHDKESYIYCDIDDIGGVGTHTHANKAHTKPLPPPIRTPSPMSEHEDDYVHF